MVKLTNLAHELIEKQQSINIAVDMTVGWGNDTLFLALHARKVYGFDIQDEALAFTRSLLSMNAIDNVELIKADHQFLDSYIKEPIDLVIYNLGYLPESDKIVRTNSSSTIASLKKAVHMINQNGLIIIVVYPDDLNEANEVKTFVSGLDSNFDVLQYSILNKTKCPFLITIKKR